MKYFVWLNGILFLGLCACQPARPDGAAEFAPRLVETDEAVIWQGFSHSWVFNHRWGRLGSGFVATDPSLGVETYPVSPAAWEDELPISGWTYMASAGAGTGLDMATHRARGAMLSDAPVRTATLTAHTNLRGEEGRLTLVAPWGVEARLPDSWEGAENVAVVLNGFWLTASGDEAKQPYRFMLDVGEAVVAGRQLSVEVNVAVGFDCDTPECKGCSASALSRRSDEFEYDLHIALVVISGTEADFRHRRFQGPAVDEAWDGPPATGEADACLAERRRGRCAEYRLKCGDGRLEEYEPLEKYAGRTLVEAPPGPPRWRSTIAITSIDLRLDEPHHMLALDLLADDLRWDEESGRLSFRQDLRFENWRHGMSQAGRALDARAVTTFGTAGWYTGTLGYARLDFSRASLRPQEIDERIVTARGQTVVVHLDQPSRQLELTKPDRESPRSGAAGEVGDTLSRPRSFLRNARLIDTDDVAVRPLAR